LALKLASGFKNREARRKVFVAARMRSDSGWVDVTIRNISSRGILVQTVDPPAPGRAIELRRASHIIIARVVWRGRGEFGVRTQDVLAIDDIVAPPGDATPRADGRPGERRRDPERLAAAAVAAKLEASRQRAAMFQYVVLAGGALAAALFAGFKVYGLLARMAAAVSANLP